LAAGLDQSLLTTLVDSGSIRRTGAVTYLGEVNGKGSDTGRVRFASLGGADEFTNTAAEDTDVAETALTDASVDIAVVRSALKREIGDLAIGTGYADDVNPDRLAADMVASLEAYFTTQVATTIAGFSTDVGTTTVDMTVDDYYDAIFQLEISDVPGPYYCLLHGRQLADFQSSLRGEVGPGQHIAASQEMLAIKGQGFAGNYLGVDIHKNNRVTSSGGNRHGGMWGANCIGYKNMVVDAARFKLGAGATVAVRMDELVVEIYRSPSQALVNVMGNAYLGFAILEDARGVGIVTDA
jgi:hypothetical protein